MNKQLIVLLLGIFILTVLLIMLIEFIIEDFKCFKTKLNQDYVRKHYRKKIIKNFCEVKHQHIFLEQNFVNGNGIYQTIQHSHNKTIHVPKYEIKKSNRALTNVVKVFNAIFVLLLFVSASLSLYLKFSSTYLTINGYTYTTVQSGSMSYINETNSYIKENNLINQIDTFSLIQLKRVEFNEPINQYSIYAYRNKKGYLIVHRLIEKKMVNDEEVYVFRGDANSESDYFYVKRNQIEFIYTGWNEIFFGHIISFLNSINGLLSITYILIVLIVLDYFNKKRSQLIDVELKRYLDILNGTRY